MMRRDVEAAATKFILSLGFPYVQIGPRYKWATRWAGPSRKQLANFFAL